MRALLLVGGLAVMAASCDQLPDFRAGDVDAARLSLSLDVTEVLDWGGVSSVRLALTNDGDGPSRGVHVELYFPSWLEFSSVEPPGTEVSLLSADPETRLTYRLGDPALRPGETRTIVQRIRVPPREAPRMEPDPQEDADTIAVNGQPVPANRVLRARLVSPGGEQLGAEVRTVMPFRGAASVSPPPARADTAGAEARIGHDRVGPIRLGATVAELRSAAPAARDTTFTLGEGLRERGLLVPLAGGRNALALVVDDRVDRIIVRDTGIRTELGHGVGSTFQELRQAYGSPCTARTQDGRTAVWFPNLPGVSFAFDATGATPQDGAETAAQSHPPDDAQVRELWVRRGADRC
jgi:hypothetical protein